MPLPKNASNDSLHRFNCCEAFKRCPPKAWEFLFYIPNPHHPIEGDGDCSAHFCLVLPDAYKEASCKLDPAYRAVALITRRPRSSIRSQGYMIFRPHTACCTCPKRPRELETSVVNREIEESNQGSKRIESPCHLYDRHRTTNRGHFETWSWYNDSVIPIQAPKMVHIECLHLKRPLTQPRFGLALDYLSVLMFEEMFRDFRETRKNDDESIPVGQRRVVAGGFRPMRTWSQSISMTLSTVVSLGIGT